MTETETGAQGQDAARGAHQAVPQTNGGNGGNGGRFAQARRLRLPLMLAGVLIVVVGGLGAYLTGGRYEKTDNAYVRVASVGVSSDIGGRVNRILVRENQHVRAGQVLYTIDSSSSDVAVRQAAAELANVQLQIREDEAAYRQRLAELNAAEETARYREKDRVRDAAMLKAGAVSKETYDESAHEAEQARKQIVVVRQQLAAAAAKLGGSAPGSHPEVRAASAAVARAELQQGYNVVRAPQDGVITKVEQLQVGDIVTAGRPVFNLVADDVWVEAAFKENQLNHLRPGEPATVTVDAYPGRTFQARLQSIAPGTDQTFSSLPAENASGNWVKVVQRVPVRLAFTRKPDITLQGGLSAVVKVDTGHKRSLTDLFGGR